jgi:hypothetical protein
MHPIFGPDGTALGDSVEHWIMDGARLVALVVFPSFMSGRCRIWFQAEVTLLSWRRATPTSPLRDNRNRHQEPANANSQSPASRSPPKGLHVSLVVEHRIFAAAPTTTTVIRAAPAPGPAASLWLEASAPTCPSGWQSAVVEAPMSWAATAARKRWR